MPGITYIVKHSIRQNRAVMFKVKSFLHNNTFLNQSFRMEYAKLKLIYHKRIINIFLRSSVCIGLKFETPENFLQDP